MLSYLKGLSFHPPVKRKTVMNVTLPSRRGIALALAAFALGVLAPRAIRARDSLPPQQVHMQAALESLKAAQEHLGQAVADKGGHRVKAMQHTKLAIQETQAGIEYARAHP
jgi:hypothetical protein